MLETLFGSVNQERVLLYILCRNEGYAREISRFFDADLDPIQKQLGKLEYGNILISRNVGRTRLFSFNPRYPFLNELKTLLEKALTFYPVEERERLTHARKRPRRTDKPL